MTAATVAKPAPAGRGRVEDDALLRGAGTLRRRREAGGRARRLFRALAARLCHHRPHRHGGSEKNERRGRGLYRRRSGRGALSFGLARASIFPAAAARCRCRRIARRSPRDACCISASRSPWWWRGMRGAAQDAADKVVVDYTPLDAVTDVRAAVKAGAPQLWPEAPGNIAFDWTAPADPEGKKQAALDKAFKEAAHVVRVELVNQRLVVAVARAAQRHRQLRRSSQDVHAALPVAVGRRHARAGRRLRSTSSRRNCTCSPATSAAPSA